MYLSTLSFLITHVAPPSPFTRFVLKGWCAWRRRAFPTCLFSSLRVVCCACHAEWTWTRPNSACHEKWKSSSDNLAKVLRLSQKRLSTPCADTSECQDAPGLPRKTTLNLLGHLRKREVQQPPHRISFCVAGAIFRTLYTPHSAPPTHHTLQFTLYTLHSTLYTPHSTLFTLHTSHFWLTFYTLHFIIYTPHATPHTLHFTLHTLHSTLYIPHFTFHTLHSTLYTLHLHATLHSLHSTLYTVHSTLYTPRFTFFTWHFTPHTPQFPPPHLTLYTQHSPLNIPPPSHSTLCTSPPSTFHSVYSALVRQQRNMHKTLQITCFTRVFYVTAFGFVGCFLLLVFSRSWTVRFALPLTGHQCGGATSANGWNVPTPRGSRPSLTMASWDIPELHGHFDGKVRWKYMGNHLKLLEIMNTIHY